MLTRGRIIAFCVCSLLYFLASFYLFGTSFYWFVLHRDGEPMGFHWDSTPLLGVWLLDVVGVRCRPSEWWLWQLLALFAFNSVFLMAGVFWVQSIVRGWTSRARTKG